jgi:flagellar hook assembly protein FlgD
MIRYTLPKATAVTIEVFDAAGSLVRRLAEGQRPAGSFTTPWDGRDGGGRQLPTGIYFARIVTGDGTIMTHVVLTR